MQQGPGGWVWVMGRIGHFGGLFRAVKDTVGHRVVALYSGIFWYFYTGMDL